MKILLGLLLTASCAVAQYKLEVAGPPPAGLSPAIAGLLKPAGHKILAPGGKPWCEVWFVDSAPTGPDTTESDVSWKTALPGAVVGVIHWPESGSDRRGQVIKAGLYTMRFSMFPINGDHQGVAPQRDFLLMTPAADDKDSAPVSNFDDLVNMSRKTSGTPHPAVLSMWKVESDFSPGLNQLGETDWVLHAKVGNVAIALVLVGKVEG